MKYEPIKELLEKVFHKHVWMRILLYHLLYLLLLRTWHIKKVLKKILSDKNAELNILDAGSGFGQYSYFLSKFLKNSKIKGIDIQHLHVDDCNSFFKKIGKIDQVSFQQADLTQYINPNAFDLILCVDVMEHIKNDQVVLSNFYQSLKRNGILLISTPSDKGGSDAHDPNDESFIEEHVRNGYSIDDITTKLHNSGFGHCQCIYQYGMPGALSWKLSMKLPIMALNKSKLFFLVLPFYYLFVMPFCLLLNFLDTKLTHQSGTGLIVIAYK